MWTFEVQSIEPIIVRPSPLLTVTSQSPFLDAELFGPHAVTARFSSQLRTHSHTSRFRGGCVLPGLFVPCAPQGGDGQEHTNAKYGTVGQSLYYGGGYLRTKNSGAKAVKTKTSTPRSRDHLILFDYESDPRGSLFRLRSSTTTRWLRLQSPTDGKGAKMLWHR